MWMFKSLFELVIFGAAIGTVLIGYVILNLSIAASDRHVRRIAFTLGIVGAAVAGWIMR